MATEKENSGSNIRTLQRALDILSCFSEWEPELTLTQIAGKINLAKSTTTRLLATLEQNGYVEKDQTTLKYRLGRRMYYMGHVAGKSIDLRTIGQPIMKELRDETTETINLYILDGLHRVCIEQYKGLNAISHSIKIGERYPLWAGAGGKAMLAFQEHDFIQSVLQTAVNPRPELLQELQHIQTALSCSSIDEEEIGSSAVSAPIFHIDGKVKASLSISGPTIRFSEENIARYKELVRKAALSISAQMGYVQAEQLL